MPGGFNSSQHITSQFLRQIDRPQQILDIGAGSGEYGKLLRQLYPKSKTTAVETEQDYIRDYKLKSIYTHVRHMNAAQLINEVTHYDVVIFGDVIEHMPKSVGTNLLHHFSYRCAYLLVVFPEQLQQDTWKGYASEIHRSHWVKQDFTYFKHQHIIIKVGQNQKRNKHIIAIDGLDTHTKQWHNLNIKT